MRNKFKVGDKVTCVDSSGAAKLTVGMTYEVKKVTYEYIFVAGGSYFHYRFKLAKFIGSAIIRKTRNGGFRVNLTGRNNERMYTSEVYTTKAKALKTAKLMKDFEIIDKTK